MSRNNKNELLKSVVLHLHLHYLSINSPSLSQACLPQLEAEYGGDAGHGHGHGHASPYAVTSCQDPRLGQVMGMVGTK